MKEQYREQRSFAFVESTMQDFGYALRVLRKSPGFTITAVLTLALAIGANTAMFSVLNAVLLRPLPYRSPEQLVVLFSENPNQNLRAGRTAYWNIEEWGRQSESFAELSFSDGASATLTTEDGVEKISVLRHSANRLPMLGIQPLHGRNFTADEAEQRRRVAVIGHRFWQRRFGGSLRALGATIVVDGVPCEVVGVLPAGYAPDNEVWQPHTVLPDWESLRRARGAGMWSVMGRLRPGVTVERAQAEMSAIARRLDSEMPPDQRNLGVSVVPLDVQMTGRSARLALWMLAGAVLCVLLVAVTNVASLSLARSAGREREIAVRAALGAGRARIVRQLLAESLTLAAMAGSLGLLVAQTAIRVILAFKPANLARFDEVTLDARVLGCALALCLVSGILVGLAPAATMTNRDLSEAAREGGRSVAGGAATRRTRRALVVSEFSVAIVLLVGAGLLVRSLWRVEDQELGFRPEGLLMMQLSTTHFQTTAQRTSYYDGVLSEVQALRGVESATIIGDLFIGGSVERLVTAEGSAAGLRMRLRTDEASPRFFQAVRTPLLHGRSFSAYDGTAGPLVAVVNAAMARVLWPAGDAVGRRFKLGAADAPAPWYTVVGVVGDMRRQGMENEPVAQMFEPLAQSPSRLATLLVRTEAEDPLTMSGAVQSAIRRVDKHVPVYGVTTVEKRIGGFLAERRFQTWLLMTFSGVGLFMAAIGIYGVIQYSVARRTHEIGIRMALGAKSGEIFRLVIGEGLKLSLAGLAIGLAGAWWLGRAGASLLFGVSPTDPLTYAAVSILLVSVALAACYFPARRAMQLDPTQALRQD